MAIRIKAIENDETRFAYHESPAAIVSEPVSETITEIGPKDNLISAAIAQEQIWHFCKRMRKEFLGDWRIHEAGSLRRGLPWIHDIDFVILLSKEMDTESIRKGISAFIKAEWDWTVHVDWRFCVEENLGSMLLYLTGDAQHNITMRMHAKAKGLFLNEYGLWGNTGWPNHEVKLIAARTEKAIYKRLALCWIPPSQRSFKIQRQSELKLSPWTCSECWDGMNDFRSWKDDTTCQGCINQHLARGEIP